MLGKAARGPGRRDPVGTSMQGCVANELLSTQRWVAWVGVEVFYHSIYYYHEKRTTSSHMSLQEALKLVC